MTAISKGNNQARQQHSQSPQAQLVREAKSIQSFIKGQAVSKAISRVTSPMEFARGAGVPSALRSKFPVLSSALPPQRPTAPVSPELREELVGNIVGEMLIVQNMCGAGPTGTYYEHLTAMQEIPGGLRLAANAAAMLLAACSEWRLQLVC